MCLGKGKNNLLVLKSMEEKWCQWKGHMVSVLSRGLAFAYLIDCYLFQLEDREEWLEPEAEVSWKTCKTLGISSLLQGWGKLMWNWAGEKGISPHYLCSTLGFSVAMAPWRLKKVTAGGNAALSSDRRAMIPWNAWQGVWWSLIQTWVDLPLHICKLTLSPQFSWK